MVKIFWKKLLWYSLVCAQLATIAHLASSELDLVRSSGAIGPALDPSEVNSEGDVSILAVGDSYTYGHGLEDRSNAWPAVLQEQLTERSSSDISVTPLARPGDGIEKRAEYLEEATRSHDPEIVILQMNSRDYIDKEKLSEIFWDRIPEENLTESEEHNIRGEIKLEYIENATPEFKRERFRRYFARINQTMDGDEEVYVLNDYIKTYNHPNFVKLFAERYGWSYYQWNKFYEGEAEPREIQISPSDPHYNTYGNRLWAEDLSDILLKESSYLQANYDNIAEAQMTREVKKSPISHVYKRNSTFRLNIGVDGTSLPTWHVKTNSEGLRGPDFDRKPEEGINRVLVIGDSMTFGWGLNYSDVYTAKVEDKLEKSTGSDFQVINAGIYGTGLKDFKAFLEHRGVDYEPDLVVIAFQKRDMFSAENQTKFKNMAEESIPENASNREEKIRERRKELKEKYYSSTNIESSFIPETMGEILQTGKKEEIPVVFYYIGHESDPGTLKEWAEKREATFVTVPQEMRNRETEELILDPKDQHYNKYSHELLAEKLHAAISKIGAFEEN